MKRAGLELPDAIYQQVEQLAAEVDLTVPEFLRQAAEQIVQQHARRQSKSNGDWQFPEGRRLGAFRAPVEDWRLLANEAAD